jgi:hypothetical protein
MQNQQALCLELREPELWRPAEGFSLWRMETGGDGVAAVVRVGAGLSIWGMELPLRAAGLHAAPALDSFLPVRWMPEASWPATLKRRKARKPVNGLRLSREEEQ